MTTTAEHRATRLATYVNLRADWVMDYVDARIARRRGNVTETQIARWEAQSELAWRRHHPHIVALFGGVA